jgi:chromosome partitioning protein
MTILLNAHTKGGVKKTTTTLNLAVQRVIATGRRVLLVDCDSGLSLTAWNKHRHDRGQLPAITCVQLFGNGVDSEVRQLAEVFDDIIIDAGGEGVGAPEIRRILTVADKVLTPCGTSQVDWDRLAGIRSMITDARSVNPHLDAMLFAIGAATHAQSRDVEKFYNGVGGFPEYRLLDTVVRDRTAYKRWLDFVEPPLGEQVAYTHGEGAGLAVMEQRRPDKACVDEINRLYMEVFND